MSIERDDIPRIPCEKPYRGIIKLLFLNSKREELFSPMEIFAAPGDTVELVFYSIGDDTIFEMGSVVSLKKE